jgi:outer membrane immunogenic protein
MKHSICIILRPAALAGSLLVAGTMASAQDRDWTGYYAGVHLGYLSGETTALDIDSGLPPNSAYGVLAGLQLGHDMQNGSTVMGWAVDLSVSGVTNGVDFDSACTPYCEQVDLNWMSTVRGRYGMAQGNALYYATGGLALASMTGIDWDVPDEGSDTNLHFGAILGAGAEFGVSETMTGFAELNYLKFQDESYDLGTPDDVDLDGFTVKIGSNIRF